MSNRKHDVIDHQVKPVDFDRDAALHEMEARPLDILVIGGGITGVSATLDAAMRGLRVGLIERDDFASGTSSASSKMIHGGIRYIEQKEFRIVFHSLLERQRMYERAPHLVSRLPFMFPIYRTSGVFSPTLAKAFDKALYLYDAMGGWRIHKLHRTMNAEETLTHCPGLKQDGLLGGLLYFDTRTDDARLTVAIARTAAAHGAFVANHCEVTSLKTHKGGIQEAHISVTGIDGSTTDATIKAKVIVNAAGVWCDDVDTLSDPRYVKKIRPAKGVHIVLPWEKVRSQSTLVFPMLGEMRGKGGSAFVVRWGDYCYIGTTDTPYTGNLDDPRCERHEAEMLVESLNDAIPSSHVTLADITGTWAGLRPLIDTGKGSTAELSREHEVTVNNGVVTVAGGKLTISRFMGEQAIDAACKLLGTHRGSKTKKAPIIGGAHFDAEAVEATGGLFSHLAGRYGTEARFVEDIAITEPEMAERMMPGLPYIWAEAVFAIRHEMASTVTDVLKRRIPARFLNSAQAAEIAPRVGDLLLKELHVSKAVIEKQVSAFTADIAREKEELSES